MKAERKSGFEPIIITIETEAEARNLWHRLNCGERDFVGYVRRNSNASVGDIAYSVSSHMWGVLNSVFTPK